MVLPQTPAGRIALAIILSLLAHAIALLAPLVKLPLREVPPPPIVARLEPVPKAATRLGSPPEIVAKPAPVVAETAVQPDKHMIEEKQPVEEKQAVNKRPTEEPQIASEPQQPTTVAVAEETNPAPPTLPKQVQLTFAVYKGKSGFQVGESRHKLEIADHRYTLSATTETTGIASIFKIYRLVQTSSGILTKQGLMPEQFSEDKTDAQGKHLLSASFDWEAHTLSLSGGNKYELPAQAQDVLSFLYQFSQMPFNAGILPISISNGKKLDHYNFEINMEEIIDTRLGQLRTVKLSKMHAKGEEGTEIWLGLDYRLLPVKIRQIDRAGEITGEMLVSELRAAEE